MALLPGEGPPGPPLTPDEADEVTNMARRLAAIVLMEPSLNDNYQVFFFFFFFLQD